MALPSAHAVVNMVAVISPEPKIPGDAATLANSSSLTAETFSRPEGPESIRLPEETGQDSRVPGEPSWTSGADPGADPGDQGHDSINDSRTGSSASPGPMRRRIHLDDSDHIILAQLLVHNKEQYTQRKRGDFWSLIKERFANITGKELKDPQSSQKTLVKTRKTRRSLVSTELAEILDKWIEFIDSIEAAKPQTPTYDSINEDLKGKKRTLDEMNFSNSSNNGNNHSSHSHSHSIHNLISPPATSSANLPSTKDIGDNLSQAFTSFTSYISQTIRQNDLSQTKKLDGIEQSLDRLLENDITAAKKHSGLEQSFNRLQTDSAQASKLDSIEQSLDKLQQSLKNIEGLLDLLVTRSYKP